MQRSARRIDRVEAGLIVSPSDPVTHHVHCVQCHGSAELQFLDWPLDGLVIRHNWICPYCATENRGEFPGRVAWVTKTRHESKATH